MDTQLLIAILTALPALLTAIAAFWHSVSTKQDIQQRLDYVEDHVERVAREQKATPPFEPPPPTTVVVPPHRLL